MVEPSTADQEEEDSQVKEEVVSGSKAEHTADSLTKAERSVALGTASHPSPSPGFKPSHNASLLAGYAHELKTPMTIISGYLELFLEGALGPLTEKQESVLRDAATNCARLKKVVQEFLSQAAASVQQVALHLELGDLNQCLAEVCDFWRQRVLAKKIALYLQPYPEIEPFLFDYDKIQHVVSNLLDNAIKFTPSGGSIWLTTQHAQIEASSKDMQASSLGRIGSQVDLLPAIRVTVVDTGPGIPAEFRAAVFQDFFRIPNRTSSEGNGLGLSIAERLVRAHRGRIWVENEPGAGTRVSFLIPVNGQADVPYPPNEDGS